MLRTTIVVLSLILLAALVLIGCSRDELTSPAPSAEGSAEPLPSKAASSVILVPDADLTPAVGWPALSATPHIAWTEIDEGVANLDIYDIIYTMSVNALEILTFTNMSTATDVDVSELEFVIPMHSGADTAFMVGFTLTYFINDVEQDSATYECGDMPGIDCGADTLSFVFDDVCYTAAEINTLKIELRSIGSYWSPQMSQIMIYAIDCVVGYDEVCEPEIQNLNPARKGNNFAVQWDTPCTATSEVDWGYASDALNSTAVGFSGTSHVVNFTVADNEGCVYMMARSEGATCSEMVETSAVQTSIKAVAISDVARAFDGLGCQFTTTWTTNVKSSSKVYWGLSPSQLNNVATGVGNTTSHSVSFDATGIPRKTRVYIKAESATSCDSTQSGTAFVNRQYCIAGP